MAPAHFPAVARCRYTLLLGEWLHEAWQDAGPGEQIRFELALEQIKVGKLAKTRQQTTPPIPMLLCDRELHWLAVSPRALGLSTLAVVHKQEPCPHDSA